MPEDLSRPSIDSLIEEAFPYIKVRTMLDVLSECIVQRRSLSQVMANPDFQGFDSSPIIGFQQEVERRCNTLQPSDAKDGYKNFWLRVWDIVTLDRSLSAMGAEGFADANSADAIHYRYMTETDGRHIQQTMQQGQQLLAEAKYKELFDLILAREIERTNFLQEAIPVTEHQAGLHIAYGDSLIFLSSVVRPTQPPQ